MTIEYNTDGNNKDLSLSLCHSLSSAYIRWGLGCSVEPPSKENKLYFCNSPTTQRTNPRRNLSERQRIDEHFDSRPQRIGRFYKPKWEENQQFRSVLPAQPKKKSTRRQGGDGDDRSSYRQDGGEECSRGERDWLNLGGERGSWCRVRRG